MATAAVLPQWTSAMWSVDGNRSSAAPAMSATTALSSHTNSQQPHLGVTVEGSDGGLLRDSNAAPHVNQHFNPSQSSYEPSASASSSLFSRSELQAIDGFLESFSAPLSHSSTSSVLPSHPTNAYSAPYSTAPSLYRPEHATGWRGPPTIASSVAPTIYNSNIHPTSKYASYHPSAYQRPSSPSSASASSSSLPLHHGRADHPLLATSSASGLAAVRPPRLSNSPFSNASHAEESPDERERRLRNQANDLAGWLSRYNNAGPPVPTPQQQPSSGQPYTHASTSKARDNPSSSASPIRPAQAGPSSIGSTSNSESLPTPSSRGPSHMPYVDYVSGLASMSGGIRPSDMALAKLQAHPTTAAVGHPAQIPSEENTPVSALADSQIGTTAAKAKAKPTKPAGPAKKKTSSTTAAVRERKKPAAKLPPGKVAKSVTSSASVSVLPPKVEPSPPILPEASATSSTVAPDGVSASSVAAAAAAKTALTEEQKRANHIASEQKRRHAIRAAYDALCTVVPSLNAAVKEYEDRLSKLHPSAMKAANGDEDAMELDPSGTLVPVQTVAGVLTGGIEVGGEKIDGRAGPRSEAVVLAKSESMSFDYMPSALLVLMKAMICRRR